MDIHLERRGNRVWMACNWRNGLGDQIDMIPGAGASKTKKAMQWARGMLGFAPKCVFTFPLSWRGCVDIRWTFKKDNIVIGPELSEWAWEQRTRREDLEWIRVQEELPIPIVEKEYPRLATAMQNRSYQTIGVNFLVRARQALLADDPGLGKTLQAAGAVVEAQTAGPCLILAPSSAAAITWPDEFDEWFPDETYYVADGDRGWREEVFAQFWEDVNEHPTERTWIFCNIEMVQNDRELHQKWVAKSQGIWDMQYELVMESWAHYKVSVEDGEITDKQLIEAMKEEFPDWRRVNEWLNSGKPRFAGLFDTPWSAVIVDEGHRFLPTNSSVPDKQSQTRAAAQRIPLVADGLRYVLTGTPMRGKPLNIWGSFHWLDPVQYHAYWSYVTRFWDVAQSDSGFGLDLEMNQDAVKQYTEDLDAMMLRRTKQEVAPFLPPKVYAGTHLDHEDPDSTVGVWLDMHPKQEKAYGQMVEEAVAQLDSGQLFANGMLAEMTRCKQMACAFGDVEHVLKRAPGLDFDEWVATFSARFPSNKWDWIEGFLEERGIWKPKQAWGENKVIIGSWQSNLLRMFRAQATKYGIPSLIITGAENTTARRESKAQFQAPGGPRLFFLNTISGGTSLTLDAADDMIILDETWNPDDQTQLEDRIHRVSRPDHQATYWYLRSRGTIEEQIARANLGADSLQRQLMDGRRGVQIARRLLTGG